MKRVKFASLVPLIKRDYVKKSPIYTRTGDLGTSSLYNGERKPKDDFRFHSLGDVESVKNGLEEQLGWIQSRLLDLGSNIATPRESNEAKLARTHFDSNHIKVLEGWIDEWDEKLPKLVNFILPGGSQSSCQLHVARSVCRRAERSVIPLMNEVDPVVYQFLNRLSDYLFVVARYASQFEKYDEIVYKK